MNNIEQVAQLTESLKKAGKSLAEIVWQTAKACVGWPYVFGAWGELCTPPNRRRRYSIKHPTIKTKCKNFNGDKTCSGCQWLPDGFNVRIYDCRGFTDWCLKQVGIDLYGEGATSQWNHAANWSVKGEIKDMPKDTLCCLFVKSGKTMEHTGLGYNNETVECSSGVQYFSSRKAKWTHYAVPAGISGSIPGVKPMLRKGDKGGYVKELQLELEKRGYDLGKYGADGSFGKCTEAAVKAFQADNGLAADGICGPATWAAFDTPARKLTIIIPNLFEQQANKLLAEYPGAYVEEND